MSSTNSSSPILAQLVATENNNIELLSSLTKSANSNNESEDVIINGQTFKMPSYGYLKSEIDRLNKNFELLSG
jgi:hypothetical protein